MHWAISGKTAAKNYLSEQELLALNERAILVHAGKISYELALGYAEAQYDKFNFKRIKTCDAKDSDFDRTVKIIERKAAKRLLDKKGRK